MDKVIAISCSIGWGLALAFGLMLIFNKPQEKSLEEMFKQGDLMLKLSRYNDMPCLVNKVGISCDWQFVRGYNSEFQNSNFNYGGFSTCFSGK